MSSLRPKLLIIGGSGLLGTNAAIQLRDHYDVVLGLHNRVIKITGTGSVKIEFQDEASIHKTLNEINPNVILNAAAVANVEECEAFPQRANEVNLELAKTLAEYSSAARVKLVHISTDQLFDGREKYYPENHPCSPQNVYAATKQQAENEVQKRDPNALVIRTNFFGWGPQYRMSFSDWILENLASKKLTTLFTDVYFTPILVELLITVIEELWTSDSCGVFNVCGSERISKMQFGLLLADVFNQDASLLIEGQLTARNDLIKRPLDMSLDNSKLIQHRGIGLPSLRAQTFSRISQAEIFPRGTKLMIPYGKHYIDEDDIQAVVDVLRNGLLTQGPMVERFERAIADYVGAKYAVAVSSGTAALHIATLAAGVGPSDAVATSPITFVASANAGLYCGGEVVFADVDPNTINMSPASLKKCLLDNPNIKAIVPVHFSGLPCDMKVIKELADSSGALVIEDAAHALGALYPNKSKVGCCAYSAMTVFSFHPVKAIAAGEGGMITTNDESLYRHLIRLRSHGINKLDDNFLLPEQSVTDGVINPWYYEMQELGYHYRITDIQCALGLSQMRHLDSFMSRRRLIAHNYDKALMDMPLVTPAQTVSKMLSGNHIYPVRIDFENLGKSRNRVMQELRGLGVNTQVHYMPVPMQPYYASFGYDLATINESMEYYKEALTLPMFYTLTDKEQEHVIYSLKTVLTA